jgi:hypothetical protein
MLMMAVTCYSSLGFKWRKSLEASVDAAAPAHEK